MNQRARLALRLFDAKAIEVKSTEPFPTYPSAQRRRRISLQAGRALEILGHSIEYLIDEHFHERGACSESDGRMEAANLLMAINRSIYLECPEVPTFVKGGVKGVLPHIW